MFLAEGRRPAAFGVKVWLPRAGVMPASHAEDIHHAVVSVLPAVYPNLASVHIEVGFFVQYSSEQRLVLTLTIPSSACFLQKAAIVAPSALTLGRLVQESCKQRLLVMSTMTSSECWLQYGGSVVPSKLYFVNYMHCWYRQRPVLPTGCDN